MAHISANRILEITLTTGTGVLTLSGALTGYSTFGSAMAVSDTCFYSISTVDGSEWEMGLGTYSASNQLTRTTVYNSSNANDFVNFSAGSKRIFLTEPASTEDTATTKRELIGVSDVVQQDGAPTTLDPDEEVTITHSTCTNEKMIVSVFRDSHEEGLTNVSLDFDLADEGDFAQSDATNGTDFVNGTITLHNSMGGSPTAWPDQAMNGPNSPSPFVASASATYAVQYPPWKAFNRFSGVDQRQFSSGAVPAWLKIDLGSSKYITQYRLLQTIYTPAAPKTWTLDGSDDDSNWTVVDTKTDITTGWGAEQTFAIDTPGTYRYYRISVSAVQSGGSFDMDEMYLDEPGATYPINTWYTVNTTNANHFDTSVADVINSVTISASTPGSTSIRMLVSFDSRSTWKKWNGSSWATHAGGLGDISNGNTIAEVETGLTNYNPGDGEFLDFGWGLHTSSNVATPSVTLVTINYDEPVRYDIASVGSYASTAEFGVRRISPTTTKIKNLMDTEQTVFINIMVFP